MSATARPEAETKAAQQARAVGVVSLFAGLGMVFGYARDAALAAIFGASAQTDAFYVASLIPIMVGTVIVGGALGPALLPVLTGQLAQRPKDWSTVNSFLTLAILALLGCMILLFWTAAPLVRWLAPGFDGERAALAVRLVLFSAPAVALLGLAALAGIVLNALSIFHVPALGQLLVNGTAFAAVWLLASSRGIEAAIWGMVAGSVLQLAAQALAMRRQGWVYRPSLALNQPAAREVFRLSVPLFLFIVMVQCVPIVERIVASDFSAGQLSHLTFAGKLYQIPGLVLSSSVAIVIFPVLARDSTSGNLARYTATLRSGLRSVMLLILPVALWFFFAGSTWVELIFQHGEFTAVDARETAELLRWYSLAIIPAAILHMLNRAFYALRDTWTPLGIGIVYTLIYIAAALTLPRTFQLAGLPLAFLISQVAGGFLGFSVLHRRLKGRLSEWLDPALGGIVLAGLALTAGLGAWLAWGAPWLNGLSNALQAFFFAAGVIASGIIYLTVARLAGTPEAEMYLSFLSWSRWQTFIMRRVKA